MLKTLSSASRWLQTPWQRLWLRSYSWRFCSPTSCMCKSVSRSLGHGHGLDPVAHPTKPFPVPKARDLLGQSHMGLWAPWLMFARLAP